MPHHMGGLMKHLLILCLFLSAQPGLAKTAVSCNTESPTTSADVSEDVANDVFRIMWTHHYGTKYMPIHNYVVTPQDLPLLQEKATALAALGSKFTMEFPRSKCRWASPKVFQCFSGNTKIINGISVRSVSFHTSYSKKESIAGNIEIMTLHATLNLDGKSYSFGMDYNPKFCTLKR